MSATIRSLQAEIAARLSGDTATLDARVLLAHILNRPRSWIAAHPEIELEPVQIAALQDALQQLEAGMPLPYVLGHWEFYGLNIDVTPDVLIPRPETELLVEKALKWLKANPSRRRAVDVGTGSGCIPVTLAAHIPDLQMLAVDISAKALEVARLNAAKHSVSDRIQFLHADLLNLPADIRHSTFDIITANLPYIPTRTLHGLAVFNREPSVALDGGADGLDLIRRFLVDAPKYLSPGGLMLLEFEATQGEKMLQFAQETFPKAKCQIHKDLAGHDRLIEISFQS